MGLKQIIEQEASPENWKKFVAACEEERPGEIQSKNLKKTLKKNWPAGSCLFPAAWLEAVAQGAKEPYFALGLDADLNLWAYDKTPPIAYNHEIELAYEFAEKLKKFGESGLAQGLRFLRSCSEGGAGLLPKIEKLEVLDYSNYLSREAFQNFLLPCKWLSSLKALRIGQTEIDKGGEGWTELASKLHSIEKIKIHYYKPDAEFLETLFVASAARLREFFLCSIGMDDKTFRVFSNKADVSRLESLSLWGSGPSIAAYQSFFARPFPKLRRLSLETSRSGDGLLSLLLESPFLAGLESLNLKEGHFSSEAIRAFLQSPKLAKLRFLGFQNNALGDREAQILAEAPHFRNLKKLNIRECKLSRDGLEKLMASKSLSSLQTLAALHNPGFQSEGIEERLARRFQLVHE